MSFDLRPATEQDYDLLWSIQSTAMRPHIEASWRWDDALQRKLFNERFDPRRSEIVRVDGVDAGHLAVEVREDHVFLGSVALLAPFQRQGIGKEVVQYVIERADQLRLPVRLQVLKVNPARRLYERLGFTRCGESETHFQMIRECGAR
jgi:ribosomal protein S18 acetylase RimI-like enzyme